jgi:hypothetical protein
MSRPVGSKNTVRLPTKEPIFSDKGCELYPTCLGNDEYPQCPFSVCIEDLNDPESEMYDKEAARALLKWFKR